MRKTPTPSDGALDDAPPAELPPGEGGEIPAHAQFYYLGLPDAPDRLVSRVVLATEAQAGPLLKANQVRLATSAEVELAAPRFITLED